MGNKKDETPPPGIPEDATISVESNFVLFHAKSATFFARKAHEIEPALIEKPYSEQTFAYECLCASSIMSSCYFLEAVVNKIFSNSNRASDPKLPPGAHRFFLDLKLESIQKMVDIWADRKFRQGSVLKKYETVANLAGGKKLDTGKGNYQDLVQILELRNLLVHYVSKPRVIYPRQYSELEHFLKQKKILTNPANQREYHFPEYYLSHGCAEWCFNRVYEFCESFLALIGVQPEIYLVPKDESIISLKN